MYHCRSKQTYKKLFPRHARPQMKNINEINVQSSSAILFD